MSHVFTERVQDFPSQYGHFLLISHNLGLDAFFHHLRVLLHSEGEGGDPGTAGGGSIALVESGERVVIALAQEELAGVVVTAFASYPSCSAHEQLPRQISRVRCLVHDEAKFCADSDKSPGNSCEADHVAGTR